MTKYNFHGGSERSEELRGLSRLNSPGFATAFPGAILFNLPNQHHVVTLVVLLLQKLHHFIYNFSQILNCGKVFLVYLFSISWRTNSFRYSLSSLYFWISCCCRSMEILECSEDLLSLF